LAAPVRSVRPPLFRLALGGVVAQPHSPMPDAELAGTFAVVASQCDLCRVGLGLSLAVVIAALDLAAGVVLRLRFRNAAIESPGARRFLTDACMPRCPRVAAHLTYLPGLIVLRNLLRRPIPQPLRQLVLRRRQRNNWVRLALHGFVVVEGRIASMLLICGWFGRWLRSQTSHSTSAPWDWSIASSSRL
jgi:hypothetical protein